MWRREEVETECNLNKKREYLQNDARKKMNIKLLFRIRIYLSFVWVCLCNIHPFPGFLSLHVRTHILVSGRMCRLRWIFSPCLSRTYYIWISDCWLSHQFLRELHSPGSFQCAASPLFFRARLYSVYENEDEFKTPFLSFLCVCRLTEERSFML